MRLSGGRNFVESRLHMCLAKPHHKHSTYQRKREPGTAELTSFVFTCFVDVRCDVHIAELQQPFVRLCLRISSYPRLRCIKLRYRKARYCQISNLVSRFPALPCTRSNVCVWYAKCSHFCTCCTGRPLPLANAIRFGKPKTTCA